MRPKPVFFAFSGVELARYFLVSRGIAALAGPDASPAVLRFIVSPWLILVAAFFFLGLDRGRYGAFRQLILVGKLVSLFGAALALPAMVQSLGGLRPPTMGDLLSLGLAMAWDLGSGLALLFMRDGNPEPSEGERGQRDESVIESVEAR